MNTVKKTYRLEEGVVADIGTIAAECHQNEAYTVETALKFYRDYYYLQNKASLINDQIIQVFQASIQMMENSINQKTNQRLGELAIQSAIQNYIIADSLEVSQADLDRYRLRALDYIKMRQQVFKLGKFDE